MTHTDEIKEEILNKNELLRDKKFDEHGLTEDYLIGKLKDQCEAEEEFEKRISKKETKIVTKPLWKIQQDAVKEANKLKGNYPAEKHEHTGDVIFHSNVPEPDMPEKEPPPPPPPPEEEETFHVTDISTGGTGTATNYDSQTTDTVDEIPIKEQPTPEHDQDKEFKDHHRSRRDAGK